LLSKSRQLRALQNARRGPADRHTEIAIQRSPRRFIGTIVSEWLTRTPKPAQQRILPRFGFDRVFYEGETFAPPAGPLLTPEQIAQQAALDAMLENPFPVCQIVGIQKDGHIANLASALPDEPEPVLLPLMLLEIVQPKLVAEFLFLSKSPLKKIQAVKLG
jgi:hypothetical protein